MPKYAIWIGLGVVVLIVIFIIYSTAQAAKNAALQSELQRKAMQEQTSQSTNGKFVAATGNIRDIIDGLGNLFKKKENTWSGSAEEKAQISNEFDNLFQ